MKIRHWALAAGSVLMLGACGEKAREDAGAGANGAAAPSQSEIERLVENAVRPQPGQYRTSAELLEMNFPGVPRQIADAMKQQMSGSQGHQYCLTAADVEKGLEESVRRSQTGDCDYERFNVAGGRVDAVMTCREQGREARVTLAGTSGRTSSDMTMAMETEMPGLGKGTIRMRMRTARVGDCPG